MKKIIFFLIIPLLIATLLNSFTTVHEFYISVTSVDYSNSSNAMEVTQQFTAHDLEKAILKSSKIDLNIAEKNEHPKSDSLIFAYVNSGFNIEGINLNLVGWEYNLDESLWVYLASDSIQKPKSLTITNSLLTEIFEAQSNITHVNFLGNQQTHAFNKFATKFTYSTK